MFMRVITPWVRESREDSVHGKQNQLGKAVDWIAGYVVYYLLN